VAAVGVGRRNGQGRVLVTGASGGIGRAVAVRLAREGADVVLLGRTAGALDAVRAELAPGDHICCSLDVRDEDAWSAALPVIAPDGWLTGVVTAAAQLTPVGPLGSWAVEAFRSTLDVNVVGTLLAVKTSLDCLQAAGGAVVTFSGGGATSPLARYDAYAASKAAVVRLSENLAVDLAPSGVRVNSVAPGFVLSSIHQATVDAGPERAGREYHERTRRAMEHDDGDPPDLAAALVAFLLSEEAAGITGKLLSARWDPWEDPAFRTRLREERDLATLRRIDDQFFTSVPPTADLPGPTGEVE
jgi:NAD(P)-dependent dehydrogenase (short-subunit alcohol dehydrogenase family)